MLRKTFRYRSIDVVLLLKIFKKLAARSVTANIAEANCLIVLCNRLIMMLGKHLELLLENFKKEGGFTEALTADRLNGGHHLSLTLDDVCGMAEFEQD